MVIFDKVNLFEVCDNKIRLQVVNSKGRILCILHKKQFLIQYHENLKNLTNFSSDNELLVRLRDYTLPATERT